MATLEEILADQVAQHEQVTNQQGLDALVNKLISQEDKQPQNIVDIPTVMYPQELEQAPKVKASNKPVPLYTNVPSVKEANPDAIFINDGRSLESGGAPVTIRNANTQLSDNIFEGVRAQMDVISKQESPLEQQAGIINLRASVAATSAELMKQTRLMAESQVGLPGLESALTEAERLDRASPEWNNHLVDSNETRGVRLQYERAQSKAIELSKRLVLENPTIQSMNSTVNSFLAVTEANIQKSLGKADVLEAQVDQLALSIPADSVKAISYLVPGVANDPKKAAGIGLTAMKAKNPDVLAILNPGFTTNQLMPMAMAGNRSALQISSKMHSDVTKKSERDTEAEITYAYNLVNNEQFFKDNLGTLKVKDPKYAKYLSEYTQMGLMEKGKTGDENKKSFRTIIAGHILDKKRTQEAINDIDTWNGDIALRANPEVAATIDQIQTAKPGKVSLKDLVNAYVTKAPKDQRAVRMQHITDAAKSYAERNNKGLYGQIDIVAFQTQLTLSKAWFDSTAIGDAIDTAADFLNTNPGLSSLGVR